MGNGQFIHGGSGTSQIQGSLLGKAGLEDEVASRTK